MKAINLDTFSLSLLAAKEDILNGRASTDWALFAYDGFTNNLKLFDSGAGGLSELAQKFHIAKPMYGLCRITQPEVEQPRVVLICWVGEDVDECRKTECASHVPAVRNFFKEAHVFINASNKDELSEEKIAAVLEKVRPPMERYRRHSRPTEKEATVGTNYRKTNAAMEMRLINRDSFWARAEREEEERKEEEKRRATEDRRRRERDRVQQERKEAEERDRRMNEKLRMIEEQKRLDAKRQEEARRREKSRWEMQQKEHEEEMRARLKRSESIEKAAEAAALISQRSMNPREFFRQLSQSSTSPVSPRTGKPPFRRYQRSLTDTAFIFEKASASSGPTSPLSPSVTSPFSRTPTSPFNRCMSPTSPGFRPITSPQSPRAPVRSPPSSPIECSAPPMSFLPSLPESSAPPPQSSLPDLPAAQASAVTEPSCVVDSLIECSAPPRMSFLPSLRESKAPPPQSSLPELPPAQVSTVIESSSVDATLIECFAPPVSSLPNLSDSKAPPPQSSLPDLPAAQVSAVTESSSVVESQASSVDVSEQESVAVPDAPSAPLPENPVLFKELLVDTSMPSETEEELNIVVGPEVEVTLPLESCSSYLPDTPYSCQDVVEAKEVVMPRSEPVAVFPVIEVEEIIEEEELEQEEAEETAEFDLSGEQPESELSANYEPTLVEEIEADVREDAEVCVEETKDFVIEEERPDQNGVCPQNGTAKEYDDSSDQSTPERCTYIVNRVEAEDEDEDVQNEEAENGESSGDRPLLRVRALYDYQAEDDTEISFEPGDIIMDVETVDTAWWRGCSKDGRQGLFPSNYVETI